MSWHELALRLRSDRLEAASALLFELGCAGIAEDVPESQLHSAWERAPVGKAPTSRSIRASFEDPQRAAVEAALADLAPLELSWRELPAVDWGEAWKAQHTALELSPRIVVAPPWEEREGAVVIEPGQGFGTGQHPTTRLAARELDRLADEVSTLLDVGCGSGILALAGARLGLAARGVDLQPEAVEAARANALRNGVEVEFSVTPVAQLTQGAELVLANVHAEVLLTLASDLVRLTRRWLVLSGILLDREARVKEAFQALQQVRRTSDDGWICLVYTRTD